MRSVSGTFRNSFPRMPLNPPSVVGWVIAAVLMGIASLDPSYAPLFAAYNGLWQRLKKHSS